MAMPVQVNGEGRTDAAEDPPVQVRMATGVRRMDELLGGGVPGACSTVVYGPSFSGKRSFACVFLLTGLRRGTPAVVVTTEHPAADLRAELARLEPDFEQYEKDGLIEFVDTISMSVGADVDLANVQYVDGPTDLDGVAKAVDKATKRIRDDHPHLRLLVDSLSTLMSYNNARPTFHFLKVLLGKARRSGATPLMTMSAGVHETADVELFKHMADGWIEFRVESGKRMVHIAGLGICDDRSWVEYRYSPESFDIIGSFAANRIR